MAETYSLTNTNSDLSLPGDNFDKEMSRSPAAASTLAVTVATNTTETDAGYSPSADPGTDGGTGAQNYTVTAEINTGNNDLQLSVQLARVNSSGVQQSASGFSSEQQATAGAKTFTFNSLDLGTWAAGDRLRLELRLRDTSVHGNENLTYDIETSGTRVDAPWTVGGGALNHETADTEEVSESLDRLMSVNRPAADTEDLTESLDRLMSMSREGADTEEIQEAIAHILGLLKDTPDSLSIQEEIGTFLRKIGNTESEFLINEFVGRLQALNRPAADVLDIQEFLGRSSKVNRELADALDVSENVGIFKLQAPSLDDLEELAESVHGVLINPILDSACDDELQMFEEAVAVLITDGDLNDGLGSTEVHRQTSIAEISTLRVSASAPPAPPAGEANLYLIDNGGKLELRIRYPSGDNLIDVEP